jgi:hypothetical protein
MTEYDSVLTRWRSPRRLPVDDAYTDWFNAQSRCTHALRQWNTARPPARPAAYRAYLDELLLEEAAATRLEQLHSRPAAA